MDKKSIIGLVIIGAILIGFSYYNNRQMEKYQKEQAVIDSVARAKMPKDASKQAAPAAQDQLQKENAINDSLEVAAISETVGAKMVS